MNRSIAHHLLWFGACLAISVSYLPTAMGQDAEEGQFVYAGEEIADEGDYSTACNGCEPAGCEPAGCASSCCDCCSESSCGCGSDEPFTLSGLLFGDCPPFDFGGWAQISYITDSTGDVGGGTNPGTTFTNQPDRVNLQQLWFYAERVADGSCGLDWGFKFETLYGLDGVDNQAFGDDPGNWDFLNGFGDGNREAWAIPTVYGEIANGDVSVIFGKFYTLIGYEVGQAPDNFFVTHPFTFFFSEPFTHTGVLVSTPLTDDISFTGGWVAGNDTGFNIVEGGSAFLGSISFTLTENFSLSYTLNVGDFGRTGNGIHQTVLLNYVEGDFEWVLQNDVVKHEGFPPSSDFDSINIANFLFYQLNDCWKVGARAEWYKAQSTSYYNASVGLNYFPHPNLIVRPEYRYQWSPGASGGTNPMGLPVDVGLLAMDAIITF